MHGDDTVKPTASGVRLTWDDYALFPDDGKRHELIDGEHYVTPAPVRTHQVIVLNIASSIRSHLRAHPVGHVYVSPFDVILSNYDVVQPDVLYLSRERERTVETSPWVRGAPSLVVEVGSPATRKRDETIKRRLYAQHGVDEYWIVDPDLNRVTILRRAGEVFAHAAELTLDAGEVLTTPLLPDWQMPLRHVFED
ncbi:MAG TPA: Uma2 family endonuclease [Vicinamibacterales bacterium]|nr:Uma2 family endonuclease [Vicinamibacterales bacterium]